MSDQLAHARLFTPQEAAGIYSDALNYLDQFAGPLSPDDCIDALVVSVARTISQWTDEMMENRGVKSSKVVEDQE
jgi:hypothetical protein